MKSLFALAERKRLEGWARSVFLIPAVYDQLVWEDPI